MQKCLVLCPVFLHLHPKFKVHPCADQFLNLLSGLHAYFFDQAAAFPDDHALVRTFGNIDHGMNHGEVALGFLFPAFNFNRDAIGKLSKSDLPETLPARAAIWR